MRTFTVLVFVFLLTLGCPLPCAASSLSIRTVTGQNGVDTVTVSLAWDASQDATVTGYKILTGTASGAYTLSKDVGPALTGSVTIPIPPVDTTYYFVVTAYAGASESGPSNEVSTVLKGAIQQGPPPPDPRCVFPTGDRAVSIFPTRLQDPVAGVRATVSFQLASPNSPITEVDVRLNGLVAKTVNGTDLTDVGALWFPRPTVQGQYSLSLHAKNAYGCEIVQGTTFTIMK